MTEHNSFSYNIIINEYNDFMSNYKKAISNVKKSKNHFLQNVIMYMNN